MKPEIKVDVPGQLRLFRSNTFVDPYGFIREAVQNAQRAKATELKFTTTLSSLVIEDNGQGMSDVEDLLTINRSGWDSETQKEEAPFGIGFFSAFAMANTVIVESRDRMIRLVYDRLLLDPSDIDTDTIDPPVEGFRVTLLDIVPDIHEYNVSCKVRNICSTVPAIKSSINNKPIEVYSILTPTVEGAVMLPLVGMDNPGYRGWIGPAEYSWQSDLKLYHKDRYVTDLSVNGIKGCIDVDLEVLNLRAPDRQDIIRDDKYTKFMYDLKELYIKPMIMSRLGKGHPDYKLRDLVAAYLKPSEYALTLKYRKLNNLTVLDKAAKLTESELDDISYEDFDRLFDESLNSLASPSDYSGGTVESRSSLSFRSTSLESTCTSPRKIEDQLVNGKVPEVKDYHRDISFNTLSSNRNSSYYVEPKDLKNNADVIRKVISAGYFVLVPQNNLEVSALKDYLHIPYLGSSVVQTKTVYRSTKSKYSVKAERVAALVSLLLKRLDPSNPPQVSYCRLTKEVTDLIGDNILSSDVSKPVFGKDNGTILINYDVVKGSNVISVVDSRADLSELRFILSNIGELASVLDKGEALICKEIATLPVSWIVTSTVKSSQEE